MTENNLSRADLRGADLRDADLRGAKGVIAVQADQRGYRLVCFVNGGDVWFSAGCRSFPKNEALAHWGGENYPDRKRGNMYVKCVQFLANIQSGNTNGKN